MAKLKIDSDPKTDLLYHYTSMDALCSILSGFQKNRSTGNLTFWASSIFAMNDPQELLHGKEVLDTLLPAIEDLFMLSTNNRLIIEELDSERIINDFSNTPFVLSFSKNEDDLSMWTMYGDDGNGVSLIFNEEVTPSLDNRGGKAKCIEVNYHKGIDNFSNLSEIFNKGIVEWRKYDKDNMIKECKERILGQLYTQLCPYIKSEGYKKEREFRFSFCCNSIEQVKFRTNNKIIIPYIEVPIPVKYLQAIQLGPCCNYELANKSLKFLLNRCGLDRVDITKSEIPYRSL